MTASNFGGNVEVLNHSCIPKETGNGTATLENSFSDFYKMKPLPYVPEIAPEHLFQRNEKLCHTKTWTLMFFAIYV